MATDCLLFDGVLSYLVLCFIGGPQRGVGQALFLGQGERDASLEPRCGIVQTT